jgi:hypothetical protein
MDLVDRTFVMPLSCILGAMRGVAVQIGRDRDRLVVVGDGECIAEEKRLMLV